MPLQPSDAAPTPTLSYLEFPLFDYGEEDDEDFLVRIQTPTAASGLRTLEKIIYSYRCEYATLVSKPSGVFMIRPGFTSGTSGGSGALSLAYRKLHSIAVAWLPGLMVGRPVSASALSLILSLPHVYLQFSFCRWGMARRGEKKRAKPFYKHPRVATTSVGGSQGEENLWTGYRPLMGKPPPNLPWFPRAGRVFKVNPNIRRQHPRGKPPHPPGGCFFGMTWPSVLAYWGEERKKDAGGSTSTAKRLRPRRPPGLAAETAPELRRQALWAGLGKTVGARS